MSNRRTFLKQSGLAGAGLLGTSLFGTACADGAKASSGQLPHILQQANTAHDQQFNMCGYAAPAIETVRIGFIGVGNRGSAAVERMSYIEGVAINAICDVRPEKAEAAKGRIKRPGHEAKLYTEHAESWKAVCDRDDIDLVYIATHWETHAPMAVYAMEQGKHVALEIPAATTVDDCWKLVETSEKTRKHCVILENCCYDFFELLTLNLVRQGFFGELIHAEGAYIHDILRSLVDPAKRHDFWRLDENTHRNGNLYPTHGLGPICQALDVNRGDRLEYMTSMASNDFMLGPLAEAAVKENPTLRDHIGPTPRGNMNTSSIRTANGRTIMLQHDVSSPRPYSRIHLLSGTKGTALKYPLPARISTGHEGWLDDTEFAKLEAQYTPPIVKKIGELAKQVGGHGGMDFMMDWRLIDCLRNGLPVDMDVYDAALWSVIGPLSEWSVANRSAPIDIPDFTNGAWATNTPVDISMEKGGNTTVKLG